MHRLCAAAHDLRRVRRAHIERYAGAEGIGQRFAQLADVAVRVRQAVNGRAGVGEDGGDADLLQLLIVLAAQAAVDQHGLALGVCQMRGQYILGVVEFQVQSFFGRVGGALVAGDFILLFVRCGDDELRVVDHAAGDLEFLDVRGYANGFRFFKQALGSLLFLIRAAHALVGELAQQRKCAVGGYVHMLIPPEAIVFHSKRSDTRVPRRTPQALPSRMKNSMRKRYAPVSLLSAMKRVPPQ